MEKTNFSTKYLHRCYFFIRAFAPIKPPTAADIPPTIAPTGQNNAPTATADPTAAVTPSAHVIANHFITQPPPPQPP